MKKGKFFAGLSIFIIELIAVIVFILANTIIDWHTALIYLGYFIVAVFILGINIVGVYMIFDSLYTNEL